MVAKGAVRGLAAALAVVAAAATGVMTTPARAATLDEVKDRGYLRCGVFESAPGFSAAAADGRSRDGFMVRLCRAVAAAVTGDGNNVEYVFLNGNTRFEALREGAVDALFDSTTWTVGRDAGTGVAFTMPVFHDGQGFVAHRRHGWERLADVPEATVCVSSNSTSQASLADHTRRTGQALTPLVFDSWTVRWDAFLTGRCELMTTDRAVLVTHVPDRVEDPQNYVVFPDVISKEPLSVALRDDDRAWIDVVQWTLFALIAAEELDVTAATAADLRATSTHPEVRRLLGAEGDVGTALGLDAEWALRAITAGGNYGEIFAATLGDGSRFGLTRGANALWNGGGLIFAPPFR